MTDPATSAVSELEPPKIISVDDHVIEPPHVWQEYLPERFRDRGPKVIREKWAPFVHYPGARYSNEISEDGEWGDAWVYDGELIYVQKAFVAIPKAATPDGPDSFDRTVMRMEPITYEEMRPGCWDRDERIKDFELNWVDGSLPFPTFPRFCGQTFKEGKDKELGLACVQAYNNWMIEEFCEPSRGFNIPLCLIPLWDVELAVKEVERVAALGVHAICFSELPTKLDLPSIHSGEWDPLFAVCNELSVTLNMHVGSSSTTPGASPDSPEGVGGTLAFNNSMASMADWLYSGRLITFPNLMLSYSEGQIGWIPYALERADQVWEHHDSWMGNKEILPDPPSTYYWGRIFGCFTSDRHGVKNLDEVGEDNICFETDYPHTDTSWPYSKMYADELMTRVDEKAAYKILRGNAIRMLSLDRE